MLGATEFHWHSFQKFHCAREAHSECHWGKKPRSVFKVLRNRGSNKEPQMDERWQQWPSLSPLLVVEWWAVRCFYGVLMLHPPESNQKPLLCPHLTLSPIPSQGCAGSYSLEHPEILLCKTTFSKPAQWISHVLEHMLHFIFFPLMPLLPFLSQGMLGIFNLCFLEYSRVSLIWG